MCLSCLQSLLLKAAPASVQGAIMGFNHAVLSLARIHGPVWGGFALGSLGLGWPYATAALLSLCSLLTVVHVYRQQPHSDIGRASCRERVCQCGSISVVAGVLKQKKISTTSFENR